MNPRLPDYGNGSSLSNLLARFNLELLKQQLRVESPLPFLSLPNNHVSEVPSQHFLKRRLRDDFLGPHCYDELSLLYGTVPANSHPLLSRLNVGSQKQTKTFLNVTNCSSSSERSRIAQDERRPNKNQIDSISLPPQKKRKRRICMKDVCSKLAQGRSSFCFAHGGGYRCQHPDCDSGARGCTKYCIKHGGGLRCHFPECKNSARGRERLCIAHGGGKRCCTQDCNRAAQGATSYCKRHMKEIKNRKTES